AQLKLEEGAPSALTLQPVIGQRRAAKTTVRVRARGHSVELGTAQVEALRAQLKLEEGAPSALTLQPVIGQRRAAKTTVRVR
ncbi:hypothetical protein C7E12_21660, partial [Stenotrophomonas maltophilia]